MKRTRIIKSRIPSLSAPQSLVDYCSGRFSYLNQNQWQKEIIGGKLLLNGVAIHDPAKIINGGEILAWDGSGIIEPDVDTGITILYEDEWLVAVDKTGNLPVHPSGRYFNNTLVAILEERNESKIFPVHRLDRETSGIIILAFNSKSVASLSAAIAQGSKEYLALVHGAFPDEEMIVELPLGRDPESAISKKRKAWSGGIQSARTRFHKINTAGNFSLIRCFPETGRLHQIRAHLLSMSFPIVGDKLYGFDEKIFLTFIKHGMTDELLENLILPRQALHASRLDFFHPWKKQKIVIEAPLPRMFSDYYNFLNSKGLKA
ncbi:MAG: RluA family pseudouridine synthase [Smithella sp.]